jgi:hypothetical protein
MVQVGKGALLSCAKSTSKSTSKSESASSSKGCESDAKLWSAIKRSLDKDTIAMIAGLVDARNTPRNPVHHPSVQGLRKELREAPAFTPTLLDPFFRNFMVEHRGQTYDLSVTVRENEQTFIMMRGKPGAPGSTVVKHKILAHFSHSIIWNSATRAITHYTEASINKKLCSDDQEKLFYAVTAAVVTGKHIKTVNLDRVKIHLTGLGTSRNPITTLRDRVRELFSGVRPRAPLSLRDS